MDKYSKITITFKNGESVTFNKNDWDDYSYDGKSVIVKNEGAWVGIYNLDIVAAVELAKDDNDECNKQYTSSGKYMTADRYNEIRKSASRQSGAFWHCALFLASIGMQPDAIYKELRKSPGIMDTEMVDDYDKVVELEDGTQAPYGVRVIKTYLSEINSARDRHREYLEKEPLTD